MNYAIFADLATMILCGAVLVQSLRMMRSLKRVQDGSLTQVVSALDHATGQARQVLFELKGTLGTECMANARIVEEARELRDELATIISLADAAAERAAAAAGATNAWLARQHAAEAEPEPEAEPGAEAA